MHLLSCTGPKIRASLKGDRGTSGFWRFGTGICDGASATEPSMDHNCRNSVFSSFCVFQKKYQYQSQIMQESHMGAVRVRLSFRKTHCKRRLVHIQVLDKKTQWSGKPPSGTVCGDPIWRDLRRPSIRCQQAKFLFSKKTPTVNTHRTTHSLLLLQVGERLLWSISFYRGHLCWAWAWLDAKWS